jgi:hypothetical protein
VTAEIVKHGKGDKIVVFKFKRRKNYARKQGHRQKFTEVRIKDISPNRRGSAGIRWALEIDMAHKKGVGSSRNGRDVQSAVSRRSRSSAANAVTAGQHHHPPVRHQVAPGPQRRPRLRLHHLLAGRWRGAVRAQEQEAPPRDDVPPDADRSSADAEARGSSDAVAPAAAAPAAAAPAAAAPDAAGPPHAPPADTTSDRPPASA